MKLFLQQFHINMHKTAFQYNAQGVLKTCIFEKINLRPERSIVLHQAMSIPEKGLQKPNIKILNLIL